MYKRILLKLSGEALLGNEKNGIESKIGLSIKELQGKGIQVGIVIGGGNILRGASGGMDRVTADQIGMLATLINALTLQQSFTALGCKVKVLSSFECGHFVEVYSPKKAIQYLEEGFALIFAGGTGLPFFTTDTAAALRAIEIKAEILLKATKVDGVYDKDPHQHKDAVRFDHITYAEVLQRSLAVMDLTATALAMDNRLPILVFDIFATDSLKQAVFQGNIGTLVK